MKLFNNAWLLFSIPLIADLTKTYPSNLTMSLIIVSITASFIGSTAYATSKNETARLKFRNVVAIYSTGFFLSYLMFEVARYYSSLTIAGAGSAIVSYFSIDVILMVSTIIKGLPNVILNVIRNWVNGQGK